MLLLRRLADDFDSLRREYTQAMTATVEEVDLQLEILSLVAIANEQCLGGAVFLKQRRSEPSQ